MLIDIDNEVIELIDELDAKVNELLAEGDKDTALLALHQLQSLSSTTLLKAIKRINTANKRS